MQVLIAGAGKTARELLRRLSRAWKITLIDIEEKNLSQFEDSPRIARRVHGDASSRLVLTKADLDEQDFVVAVTNNDEVNIEVCRLARQSNTANIIALVNDSLNLPRFQEFNVRTICSTALIGRAVELFLDCPRLNITTIAEGTGEVMEVQVRSKAPASGKLLRDMAPRDWLVAAVHRDNELTIPHGDTKILPGDRLTIVARSEMYRSISHFFSMAEPCFPLEYGQEVLMPVNDDASNFEAIADEALYLVENSRAKGLTVLAPQHTLERLEKFKPMLEARTKVTYLQAGDSLQEAIINTTKNDSMGCVVFSLKPLAPFARFLGIPTIIALAHRLACPMLVSRRKTPYKKILVPASGTESSGLALETAFDLAQQLKASVDVIVVTDPVVRQGPGSREWAEEVLRRAREVSQMHHFPLGEVIEEGNVIKEIIAQAASYDLLIIGSTTNSASLLRPHIGEYLVQDVSCSVLVVN